MVRDSLQEELITKLRAAGMEQHIELILAEAKECAFFSNRFYKPQESVPLGTSRVSGLPDLPPHIDWPMAIGERGEPAGPARFVAQFNLAEVPEFQEFPLPRTGHLWLFARRWETGLDLPFVGIYEASAEQLVRREPPGSTASVRSYSCPMPIDFEMGYSLPWYRKSFCRAFGEDAYVADRCQRELRVVHKNGTALAGCIGGYAPDWEDYELYRWTALSRMGRSDLYGASRFDSIAEYENQIERMRRSRERFSPSDVQWKLLPVERFEAMRPGVEWIDKHRSELNAAFASWLRLFSIRENLPAAIDAGDAGCVQIMVHTPELREGRFDNLVGHMPQLS